MIHNIGSGTREESILFKFAIMGHYRAKTTAKAPEDAARKFAEPQH